MSTTNPSRPYLKYLFIVFAVLIALTSVVVSDSIIKKLAKEERQRMEVWTEAYRVLTTENPDQNMALVLRIIEGNTSIPVILVDGSKNVLSYRNLSVPERGEDAYLQKKVREFEAKNLPISIELGDGVYQYIYYDDSIILKRLLIYPYAQLSVVFVFILIAFVALAGTKRAEQNRVWVGLSKETAHQLGTPISSLLAWMEYLKTKEIDPSYLHEMSKDVKRLEVVADRFSKIGSKVEMIPIDLNEAIRATYDYMVSRISSKVKMDVETGDLSCFVLMNDSLFSWVIENLTKNAVDAMDGQGELIYRVTEKGNKVRIDVIDTGKGIPRSKQRDVFRPGYTTKERGWGLGLSLAKRIVESYPQGKVFVLSSEVGKGTTFRIELRKYQLD